MPRREDDVVAPRPADFGPRRLLVLLGFALAVLATLAVFLTDNPQYLRIAVVAVAWAFVLATFAASRRHTDRVAAAAREADLRSAYELELDREVAARREFELDLEHDLRREAEESMRYELDALRADIAALSGLRDEVARVSDLRGDLAALSGLRDEVARVAALRDDVAALMSLRQDLGQLADLRAEMSRLRAELTEQLSSEMLVERIVMRTQASRMPTESSRLDAGPGRALESSSWSDDLPPRELTGGWPAVRLDEPRGTQQFEEVRIERSGSRPPVPGPDAGRRHWEAPTPESRPWDAPLPSWDTGGTPDRSAAPATSAWPLDPAQAAGEPHHRPAGEPYSRSAWDEPAGPPPTTMSPIAPSSIARPPAPVPTPPVSPPVPPPVSAPLWQSPATEFHDVRRPLDRPPVPPPVAPPPPSPLDWLAARSLLDAPSPLDTSSSLNTSSSLDAPSSVDAPAPTTSLPSVPQFRRRVDDDPRDAAVTRPPAEPRTTHRPAVPPGPPPVRADAPAYRVRDEEPATAPGSARDKRLADILAENGVSPSGGGRRRRRYRDEGEPDDVLARVLRDS